MRAPYRIKRLEATRLDARESSVPVSDTYDAYLGRLLKMIPGEVISLYVVGSGFIPEDQAGALIAWTLVCILAVVLLRVYGTADRVLDKPPDWVHVAISSVAFVVLVYSMGGPFKALGLYIPFLGPMLVLAWTFFLPFVYKGPQD